MNNCVFQLKSIRLTELCPLVTGTDTTLKSMISVHVLQQQPLILWRRSAVLLFFCPLLRHITKRLSKPRFVCRIRADKATEHENKKRPQGGQLTKCGLLKTSPTYLSRLNANQTTETLGHVLSSPIQFFFSKFDASCEKN